MIDGVEFLRADSVQQEAEKLEGMDYVLVRADRAGVYVGYLEEENGDTVVLRDCRWIWYWSGASSIFEIANKGVSDPDGCKFPAPIKRAKISGVITILPVTEEAKTSIEQVQVWTQH